MFNSLSKYKYPIFIKCREWTCDPYWQNLLYEFANGNFDDDMNKIILNEKGFFINDKKIELTSDHKNNLLLLKKELSQKETNSIVEKSWKQIKSKNEKISLIVRYVKKQKEKFNLSNTKCKELLSNIKLGLIFKIISNDDIDYRNNEIYHIDGIEFTQGNYSMNLTEIINREIVESKPKTQNSIEKSIDKYIKEINN